jgi:hypothetical protein
MARRHGTETLGSARKHLIIKEIQAAIARELAAQSELPKTLPKRIADSLGNCIDGYVTQARAPRVSTEPNTTREGGAKRGAEPQGDYALTEESDRHRGDSARADWGPCPCSCPCAQRRRSHGCNGYRRVQRPSTPREQLQPQHI